MDTTFGAAYAAPAMASTAQKQTSARRERTGISVSLTFDYIQAKSSLVGEMQRDEFVERIISGERNG